MAQTIRPRTRLAVPQAQQPQAPQFGGQPAPSAGTPQAANWMQAPQQPRQYQPLMAGVNSALMQMQNAPEYSSPLTRNHEARVANIQGQADAASAVYDRMGRPSAGSQFSQNRAAGYQTDQYGRQYQMTPQMAGTAMPTGGAGGFVQGQSLGGAPHGIYVQSNLPRPEGGMERVAAGQQGLRPSAFSGGASSAAIAAMTGGTGPGAQRYNDMKARRQQMADQRIVARARMRGLGQNTPAVRAAMQRQGMLTPGQGVQSGQGGMTAAGSGARIPANSTEAIRGAQRLAATPFIANALQGADPLSAPPTAFMPLLEATNNPQDSQALSQFLAYKMQADPQFQQIPLPERLAINAYVMGGPAAYRQARQAQQQQSVTAPVYGSQPLVPRDEAKRIYGSPRTGSGISGF